MNSELLAMLEYLEQEKQINKQELYKIVEDALTIAARKEHDRVEIVKVKIDPKSGDIRTYVTLEVVDNIIDEHNEILLAEALELYSDCKLGDDVDVLLSTQDSLTRVGAQSTKQAILQRLKEYDVKRVKEEYSTSVGELLTGVVRHFSRGDTYIDFGRAEGVLPQSEKIPNEEFKNGDNITVILLEINEKRLGSSLVVSRTHKDLVKRLFEREVSEIVDGIVEIKAISREAGFRTKIAVHATDPLVDPVGACVGIRGTRVKAIVRELNREKIDIIEWKEDIAEYIKEALQPAECTKIDLNEDEQSVIIYTDEENYPLAIGRKGQNVRLTSRLTSWNINVEKVDSAKKTTIGDQLEHVNLTFQDIPSVDKDLANQLISNGYLSMEGLKQAERDDLLEIEDVSEEVADDILNYIANLNNLGE